MKVAINKCHGGFSLSPEATLKLYERGVTEIAIPVDKYWPPEEREERDARNPLLGYTHAITEWRKWLSGDRSNRSIFMEIFSPDEKFVLNAGREVKRDHPELIRIIEEMGEAADGQCASLAIVEIPDDVQWHVEEYDGSEWIAEDHRTWHAETRCE